MEKCKKSTNMSAPAAGRLSGRKTTPFTPLRAAEKNEKLLASFDLDVLQQQEKVEKNMMVLALTWTQKG